MCPAKPDINIKCWIAIAHHEKIDNLEKPNGYNSCDALLWVLIIFYPLCVVLFVNVQVNLVEFFPELGITGIISIWLLQDIDLFLASDREPVLYIIVRLRRTHC